ncbi:hypothetical protein [Paludifilum halophilum]|nr:hypothetical protein [Paludifilum halophilum]
MGEPAFLYRPSKLFDRVQHSLYILKTKDEVLSLVDRFHRQIPAELVTHFLRERLDYDSVQEMGDNKILVRFYDRELTKLKADPRVVLKDLGEHINRYCAEKGVKLYN